MKSLLVILAITVLISCTNTENNDSGTVKATVSEDQRIEKYKPDTVMTTVGQLVLPPPYATKSVAVVSKLVEWPEGKLPEVPEGFTVSIFADNLDNPRWTYLAPNGDYFVAESNSRGSADRITLLRDSDQDGEVDLRKVFLDDLNQPFGMLIIDNTFYVANTDGLYKFPYKKGMTSLKGTKGLKIVDLPAGGYNHHWTRNIITNEARDKIYISVGSASNVGEYGMEEEVRRANILVVDLNGENEKVYASGLRNPVGMDWNPANGELWTAVNERDKLGDNLVPDYITSVKEGGFYGWPYSYYGQIRDPRMAQGADDLVARAIMPDVPAGSHTATLGLTFYDKDQFPEKYRNGAFIGQHGSWNRSILTGYRVGFIPFEDGKPVSEPEHFMTGLIADSSKATVYGRPVCVRVTPQGSLLVNDDTGNKIWKISYTD